MEWNLRIGIRLFLLGTAIWSGQHLSAQQPVQLRNRTVPVQAARNTIGPYLAQITPGQTVQIYAQFKQPPSRAALAKQGILLQEYVGNNTFTVLLLRTKDATILEQALQYWAPVAATDKISPFLQTQHTATLVPVWLTLAAGHPLEELSAILKQCKAVIPAQQDWTSQHKWIIQVPYDQLEQLAAHDLVLSIEPKFEDQSLNDGALAVADVAEATSTEGYNLSGAGITVGVGDDSQPDHIDFNDRLRNFNPMLYTYHGLHTTGTVAGAGIVNESYKGFAPKAAIVDQFYSQIIAQAARYEQDFNMKVTNNSYAAIVGNCAYAGTYDATSQFLDQQAIDQPELLNVFAAGNDGYITCSPYPASYATVAGSYQSAKNTLVVANTGKTGDILSAGSSRGPAKDGRMKPEITATGVQINSTVFSNSYGLSTGTSMAAPNVTGAAALLQERYKQLNGGQYPGSDLLKAIMMNGATDMGNAGPDYRYGFGRLDVGQSLDIINNNRYWGQTITHNAQQSQNISVPANLAQLKIMLYWNDVPAAPSNAKALVNDLDLNVSTPGGTTRFPLVLNPEAAHVTDLATEGADHLNNAEQVMINNPDAGNYGVNVTGFNIPTGSQSYRIVYQFVTKDLKITYPGAGSKMEAGQAVYLHWYAPESSNSFTVEYSTDNGGSWSSIGTTTGDKRYISWTIPSGIHSGLCKIRLTQNGSSVLSETFIISPRPQTSLSADQCPGSIRLEWTPISGVSKYYLYHKIGPEMVRTDSTAASNYTYSGLSVDSVYWVAVGVAADNKQGIRSVALSRQPNTGSCTNITTHGDLALSRILSPVSARALTAVPMSSTLTVTAYNMDNAAANNYQVGYRINGGSWVTTNLSTNIPAGGSSTLSVPGLNLSATGTYTIDAYIRNLALTDPITANDTQTVTVRHIANDPLNLSTAFTEGFETAGPTTSLKAILGIPNATHFDFNLGGANGRMRTFVDAAVSITGNQSISLDNTINQKNNINGSSLNSLTGTFNLSGYNLGSNEIRFDFDYILHGLPKFYAENRILLRGSDLDTWIDISPIDTNNIGTAINTGSFSISDLLLANGQNFSTATQIRLEQRDTSLIGSVHFGNGITIDNFKLYEVTNDIALIKANNIQQFNCGLSNAVPLSVDVANLVNQSMSNISISYQVDQQSVVTETISSMAAKDTITYNFAQAMNLSAPGLHQVTVWVAYPGDNYANNDTLKNIEIHHQPVITSYPYLEGFEDNDGYFYSEGANNSWAYGTPNSLGITHAANGSKAWKTNLTGAYNPNETSYLYSPCFDLSSLSSPMLSFSLYREIEAPGGGEIFDRAYMEYSTDGGQVWQRLGAYGQGYNWYDNSTEDIWANTSHNFWQVASIPLPVVSSITFRWVLRSDPGAEFGGLALDDIHIFDLQKNIFDQDSFSTAPVANISSNTAFGTATEIAGYVDPLSQSLANASFQSYHHTDYISPDAQQYFLPRNFTLITNSAPASPVQLQLFVRDTAMGIVRNATSCTSCTSHPKEVYELGVTTYTDLNQGVLNNALDDDTNGVFSYIPRDSVLWIPYHDGYYAQFKTDKAGEYWFNDGGITRNNPLPLNTLTFDAYKNDAQTARIVWSSSVDTDVLLYNVQRAGKDGVFHSIHPVNAIGQNGFEYSYIDTPVLDAPYALYRVRYSSLDGRVFYSIAKKVTWSGLPVDFEVFPNPTHDGRITFTWYNPQQSGFHWEVYNVIGQQIDRGWVDQSDFNGSATISLQARGSAAGLYILKVISESGTQEYKIAYDPR